MARKKKLLDKLLSKPKNFKWNELKTLLNGYKYKEIQGKGSRVKFFREKPRNLIILHKPHPGETLLDYMVKEVIDNLKKIGVIHGND
ncbi:MAG: type II toxin-antitoxin system HicA family toxin [Desulfobacula sp.]|uniref:type II toxin-antitoxin system HicA family toxin n=1 Tax=Desulfobacula sp. TaxID=2593537 RepID=UPI0025BB1E61|nr:type II toxin-antitoxin system HicA family toxin [Desulfobacula sp.]MCD4722513.1 type II toxin-antitoxin system HicA family toxin [Desulfobacula sp.]